MIRLKLAGGALLLATVLVNPWGIPSARADWQGNVKIQGHTGPEGKPMTGKVFAQGMLMRYDVMGMSSIVDMNQQKTTILMPSSKTYLQRSGADQHGIACSPHDIDSCLKKKGFHVSGKATVNGHPCSIYESVQHIAGKDHRVKIWRPTDLKEVAFVRSQTTSMDGQELASVDVTDVKLGKLSPAMFKVPAGYHAMQMPNMSGGGGMPSGGMPSGQMPALPKNVKLPPGFKMPNMPAMPSMPGH